MSSSDKLSIIIDEYSEKFTPSEEYTDPVNKFRTSTPQALIDTDFEYGTQITKWENLAMTNYRPFAFPSTVGLGTINYITFPTGSRLVEVGIQTSPTSFGPGIGSAITVQDTFLNPANGNFLVESVAGAGNSIFRYTARSNNTTTITSIFDPNKTGIFSGTTYSNAQIGGTLAGFQTSLSGVVTFTTTIPHGLAIGNVIAIRGVSATAGPINGAFSIVRIPSNTQVSIAVTIVPSADIAGGQAFVIPQGQFLHRPFDGGVIFTSNAQGNFEQTTRQTRRYFRYQSGKGIQVSSGTILRPNLQVDSITSVGVAASVITKEQHNIQPGTIITITGCNETAYNGSFPVSVIKGYNAFEYTMAGAASSTIASGSPYVGVSTWYGSVSRLGIFDDQNGMFFEYDGTTFYACRRTSTFQLSGKVSVTNGGSTITQTNQSFPTYFSKQLTIGNFIILRGQSYRVIDIASDTSLTISPAYRGASADYVIASKTVDLRIPQSQWNIDKMDGTGPSGYNIDLNRMQMFYIDYSWYGAGFIRWGLRGTDGNVYYFHKLANNNVNTEAYMRSGNLPARYETQSIPPTTQINNTVLNTDTYVGVASTAGFPPSGTLVIRDANVYEYVNYTSIGTTAFLNVRRAQTGGPLTITMNAGSISTAGVSTANLQVGMRALHANLPSGTFISSITSLGSGTIILSQSPTSTISAGVVTFVGMGTDIPNTFTYTPTNPAAVELAYPTFAPTISHWGTSVIMDGRFDDDKSLVFTYGQSSGVNIPPNQTRALFGIRVAPSVDQGQVGAFGARELVNRMQLTLRALDVSAVSISTSTSNVNLLVQAFLNATPSVGVNWTNAVGNLQGRQNSSLAQIADYINVGLATVTGGEVTAGFFVGSGANSIGLDQVRDLGNSVLGGGGTSSNTGIYPDGPDTLTILVTNLATGIGQTANVFGRLSWTEAQA
jgi:hypothetical protein